MTIDSWPDFDGNEIAKATVRRMKVMDLEYIDPGIRPIVQVLHTHGVRTFESCEGGEGHGYPYPLVRFHGTDSDGAHAIDVAVSHLLPLRSVRRHGPVWEMAFR